MLHETSIENVSLSEIESLIESGVSEGRHYEYKSELPGKDDRSTKEFLADVTSFANSGGGVLLIGIQEESGVAVALAPIDIDNPDSAILRLENLIRDGVEPRLPGVATRALALQGGHVFVIRIPRSWVQPHAVTAKRHWRFYARTSAGKYPLDVGELRSAFELSVGSQRRVEEFRAERLAAVSNNAGPLPIAGDSLLVLHLVPLAALDPTFSIDLSSVSERPTENTFRPLGANSWDSRYCFEGFVAHRGVEESAAGTWSYSLLFRNGALEIVDSYYLNFSLRTQNRKRLASVSFEQRLLEGLKEWLAVLKAAGVSRPMVLMLTLLGVKGYSLGVGDHLRHFERREISQQDLMLPGMVLEEDDRPLHTVLRPTFDIVWNAFGYPSSLNYDEAGNWVGQ